ncbi:MAG: glycosyltransferase family 4 protein [Chloroflexota bacterium]
MQSTQNGGMESLCVDLGAELARRGLVVGVIIPEATAFDALADRFLAAKTQVFRLDTDGRAGRIAQLGRWVRLLHLYRTWRPDVIHLNTGGATGGLGVIAAARAATSATVVITEHDVPTAHPTRHQRLARQVLDHLSHAIVTISRKTAAARQERLPTAASASKFGAIPIGIPIRDVSAARRAENRREIRQELGIHQRAVVIGSVVRLAPGKGLDDLINAFALLLREQPCELLLVGDGPLRQELEELAIKRQVRDHVHFAGFHADPSPFLDAIDIFALAVLLGSGSVALLEAMAHGVPSVITFCGPEEAVIPEQTGLGAPPSNPPALAEALLRLVTSPALRDQLGAAGAAHVRQHFTIGRVANDLLDLYAAAKSSGVPTQQRIDWLPNPAYGSSHPYLAIPTTHA